MSNDNITYIGINAKQKTIKFSGNPDDVKDFGYIQKFNPDSSITFLANMILDYMLEEEWTVIVNWESIHIINPILSEWGIMPRGKVAMEVLIDGECKAIFSANPTRNQNWFSAYVFFRLYFYEKRKEIPFLPSNFSHTVRKLKWIIDH